MKCKYRRPMERQNPAFDPMEAAEARKARRPYRVPFTIMFPTGTEIEHPDAWRLVRMGVADPVDDECREAAGLTPEQIAERQARYEKLEAGRATGDPKFDAPTDTAEEDD